MGWITALPESGYRIYNALLVIVDRYSKTPIFLPCHKDDTAMHTALLLWSRVISQSGLLKNITSDRDPKFTSPLWSNLHRLFGTKLSFSTAYHPQVDGLAERMIETLEDMIGRLHQSILPNLKLLLCQKKDGIQESQQTQRKDLIDINPTASSFKIMLEKVKHHAKQSMNDAFDYAKHKWHKGHKVPDFEVGDLVLVSTLNFNNIKGPKKIQYSYVGPFVIVTLHGTNVIQVELSGELENTLTPTFQSA
ncbi:hypothetical protein O181_008792 [Austropuccinia psidii MF-1]|uniref:Integrase catalytic domain-containing protein n=1 Tax=Austropuccinia psidii MF-1 TaxID=1389203 RepID=A0A9Q3GJQ2_9BASI|nr:hypothetical protein [Austropuccinia psidii MF-1]